MEQAKQGDNIKVHYEGTLDDGTVFDSSEGHDPLEFTIGEGRVIPGFEQMVVGMSEGESKTEKIPTDQAYGPYNAEHVIEVERNAVPPEIEIEVGQQLGMKNTDGRVIQVTVTEVTEGKVTLDANHPLAGQDLTFSIKLVAIG